MRCRHILAVLLVLLVWLSFCTSCMNDETWVDRHKPGISLEDIRQGHPVIILNEGNFMYGNASISYYDAYIPQAME